MARTLFAFVGVLLLLQACRSAPEIEPFEPSKEIGNEVVAAAPVVVDDDSKKNVVKNDDVEVDADASLKKAVYFGASGTFVHGFVATLSVILVSELGDKTFFIGKNTLLGFHDKYLVDKRWLNSGLSNGLQRHLLLELPQ